MFETRKRTARIAGLLYLFLVITGVFSMVVVPSQLIVPGDASATAGNILESEFLFRLGIAANLLCQVIFLFLALTLYRLLRSVDKTYASVMVALVVVAVPIAMLNLLNQYAVLVLLGKPDFLTVFTPDQLDAFSMAFLNFYDHGIQIVQIFWGLWLFPFGVLVYRSGFLPKILGVLLIIACFTILIEAFTFFLYPVYSGTVSSYIGIFSAIGEFSIMLWLLIMGAREKASYEEVG